MHELIGVKGIWLAMKKRKTMYPQLSYYLEYLFTSG